MEVKQDLTKPVDDNSVEIKKEGTEMEQRPKTPEPTPEPEVEGCQNTECCGGEEKSPEHHHCHHSKGFMLCHSLMGIAMFVAVLVLYILHFTSGPRTKSNPNATAPIVAEGNLKIAYIDTDTLMAKYEYAIALREENERYQKQLENQFTQEATNLQNSYQKLQSDYQSFTSTDYKGMTLTQQNAKEEELKKRGAEIEKKMQQLQGRQAEYTNKASEKLLKDSEDMTNAVYAFIREYNQANQQFDLILAKSFTSSPVLYGNPGMDITEEILNGLNDEYKNTKGKKADKAEKAEKVEKVEKKAPAKK